MKKLILLLSSIALAASASAAITIEASSTILDRHNTGGTASFTLAETTGSSLLVVGFAALNDPATTATAASLNYAGSTGIAAGFNVTELVGASEDIQSSIFVWDLGAVTSGNTSISISWPDPAGTAIVRESVTFAQISGADINSIIFNSASDEAGSDATYQTTLAGVDSGSFFMASGVTRNNSRTVSSTIPGTVTYSGSNTSGRARHVLFGLAGSTGDLDVGFNVSGATDGEAITGIAIGVVPEPSTYALLAGFATLGLVMVRRRLSDR